MQIASYIISALLTNFVFSVVTSMLIVLGIEKTGGDPGTPALMMVSLLCINGVLGVVTAVLMGIAKTKYQREFPSKTSALLFLLMYVPFHILGLYFSDEQVGPLAAPLATLTVVMLFLSYVPFFHMTAQGLVNLNEFVKRQELAGNRHVKFIVLACLGAIVLFAGWFLFKPETQPSTGVLSLQDHWQLLESGGRDWQSDAYLQSVVFYPNSRLPYEISATYLSKSTPEEIYSIDIDEKGKIYETQTGEAYPMRESAALPIKRDDWQIGSAQAWNMFMKIGSVNSCTQPSEKDAFFYMVLGRIGSGKLAWELSISACSTLADHSSYYLDAKTGQTLGSYFE